MLSNFNLYIYEKYMTRAGLIIEIYISQKVIISGNGHLFFDYGGFND